MTTIDVFNGDADGICALLQLRLAEPKGSTLVTGIKRDIKLLERVSARPGDEVTVLDISLAKNAVELERVLQQGASVFYVDHHMPGEIPDHPALKTMIDTDPNVCTSLLVDRFLEGAYRGWAVVAAFGDNMITSAEQAAGQLVINSDQLSELRTLGTCINYNGYGSSIDDLHFPPDILFKELLPYQSPLDYIADKQSSFAALQAGYFDDMAKAEAVSPEHKSAVAAVYILPDETWSRRISGVFGNDLANRHPDSAHAVLSYNREGGYLVSVRAPLNNKTGADELCSEFPTGGGRKGAAGINHLPVSELDRFIDNLNKRYAA
ncbi:MAG: acetyltransferase [Sedimenticola sp.]